MNSNTPRCNAWDRDCYYLARMLEIELNDNTRAFADYVEKSTIEVMELRHEIENLRNHINLLKVQNEPNTIQD